MDDLDVTYRGFQQESGASTIFIRGTDGSEAGVVRHVVFHSPTGMGWGYAGSGAADCARSLLLAALGDAAAICPECNGTRRVVWAEDGLSARPYDAERHDIEVTDECLVCEDGHRDLPYQDFKFAFVVGWGNEWEMPRREILAWLADHGVDVAAAVLAGTTATPEHGEAAGDGAS
jgi:hypothetical protein